jgi:hypothetical protein
MGVPKLCSHRGIIPICSRSRMLWSYSDDAENSEVDRRDNMTRGVHKLDLPARRQIPQHH